MRYRSYFIYLLFLLGLVVSGFLLLERESNVELKPHYSSNWNYAVQTNLHNIYKAKDVDIVMLGDSHTYRVNWDELFGVENILNRGIDGDTTDGFLHRIDAILQINKPKYIFILGGYNDFRKGYDVNNVFENYKKIIKKSRDLGSKVVITATFYDVNGKYRERITSLNGLMQKYCKHNQIEYIDLNSKISKNGYMLGQFSSDGIHLNAQGYTKWKLGLLNRFSFLK